MCVNTIVWCDMLMQIAILLCVGCFFASLFWLPFLFWYKKYGSKQDQNIHEVRRDEKQHVDRIVDFSALRKNRINKEYKEKEEAGEKNKLTYTVSDKRVCDVFRQAFKVGMWFKNSHHLDCIVYSCSGVNDHEN